MGDRAPATLTIYDRPAVQRERVIELLGEWGFSEEWGSIRNPGSPVRLADAYVADEVSLGVCRELGEDLASLGVTFELYQDPKYEWDGEIFIHVPALGSLRGFCDPEGRLHVAAHDIDAMIGGAETLDGLVAALNAASGKRWRDAINSLTSRQTRQEVSSS